MLPRLLRRFKMPSPGAYVCVAEPFLNRGDIGVVLECIGGGGRSQAMDAESMNLDLGLRRVAEHNLVDPIGGQRRTGLSAGWKSGASGASRWPATSK
jgi:hypothetical protein